MIQETRIYRSFANIDRPLYLKLRMYEYVGLSRLKHPRLPKIAHSLLFVCYGNIVRSPACEALMKRELGRFSRNDIRVASAGLNATEGRAAHPWAIAAGSEIGISLENHRAHLLTTEAVDQADVILAMDYQNWVQLAARYPQVKNKLGMLGAYNRNRRSSLEIPDPYYSNQSNTLSCYKTLEACIHNLAGTLLKRPSAGSPTLPPEP